MPDAPYERMMFVCVFGPWCSKANGAAVHAELKRLVKAERMADRVRITKSGCLGQCGHGPIVASQPDNVWYAHVASDDAVELFETHVKTGAPVERLRYRPEKPGPNKTPEVIEAEKSQKSAD